MYRRNVAAALVAGALLAACGNGAAVVQAADGPAPVVQAGSTAEPGAPGEPGSGNGQPGEPGEPGSIDVIPPRQDHSVGFDADDPYHKGHKIHVPAKTIVALGFEFLPRRITVSPGETWTVENLDIATHILRSPTKPYAIDSGDLGAGMTEGSAGPPPARPSAATITMPTKKGTYHAACIFHTGMKLTIVVE